MAASEAGTVTLAKGAPGCVLTLSVRLAWPTFWSSRLALPLAPVVVLTVIGPGAAGIEPNSGAAAAVTVQPRL